MSDETPPRIGSNGPAAQAAVRWLACRLGFHRWERQRYFAVEGYMVDGPVCRDCRTASIKGRIRA